MSIYETNITNPKKQLEFYKQLSEQLQQQNKKQKEVIDKLELENKVLKEQMVAMVKPNYTYGVR